MPARHRSEVVAPVRCEVPYCRGYTQLLRRVNFGTYLCYRHALAIPDRDWDAMNRCKAFVEQRAAWFRCIEIAKERSL